MTHLLLLVGVIAIVGFAFYCMVCERIEANRRGHPTRRVVRTDTVSVPLVAPAPVTSIAATQPKWPTGVLATSAH